MRRGRRSIGSLELSRERQGQKPSWDRRRDRRSEATGRTEACCCLGRDKAEFRIGMRSQVFSEINLLLRQSLQNFSLVGVL